MYNESSGGGGNHHADELRYVPQRSTDQVYVQRRIGPTPFSSALRAEPTDTANGSNMTGSSITSALASDQTHEKMSYRMNYPMCVVRGGPIFPQDVVRCVPPSRSFVNSNSVDPRSEPLQIRPNVLSGNPKPNPFWQKPPKSDPAAEAKVARQLGLPNLKSPLPRDTLHPLISSLQADANKTARELHPEAGMLSNAKRTNLPCNAHVHSAIQVGAASPQTNNNNNNNTSTSVMGNSSTTSGSGLPSANNNNNNNQNSQNNNNRPGTADTNFTSQSYNTNNNEEYGDGNENTFSGTGGGGKNSGLRKRRPHDQRDDIGRAYAAEGGLRDASEYADNVQHFASSMPTSLTAIAAKALGRALHDGPVTTVPALHGSYKSPNSSATKKNNNTPMTLPSSPAFRNLSSATRSVLSDRSRDTRNLVEKVVCETVPLTGPAPNDLTQMMAEVLENGGITNASVGTGTLSPSSDHHHHHVGSGGNGAAGITAMNIKNTLSAPTHGVTRADEVEIGEILRVPIDLSPLLCAGSALHGWDLAMASLKGAALSENSPNSAASSVLNSGKLRQVTTQSASLFSAATSRPKLVQYLTDVGIRTGDSLYQILAPSQSDFTRQPERAKNLRQFQNTTETPGNTYGFDNGRFQVLLENRGFDLEEVSLNGATFLDPKTVRLFGQYSPFLRLLDLSSCTQLCGEDVAAALARCRSSLRLLNFSHVDSIDGKTLDKILPNLKNLVVLSMAGLNRLNPSDDFAFQHLCSMKALRVLDVSFCSTIGDGSIVSAAQGCPSLEYIDMRGCSNITDAAVAAVGSYCTQLRCWRLSYCSKLTSASLIHLTRHAKKLEVLSMDGMSSGVLTEPVFASSIFGGRNLVSLSLAGTSNRNLKDESIAFLIRYCPKLVHLDLSGSRSFSIDALTNLIYELKSLRRLVLSASGLSKDQTALLRQVKSSVEIIDHEASGSNHSGESKRIFGVKEPPPPPPPPKKKK